MRDKARKRAADERRRRSRGVQPRYAPSYVKYETTEGEPRTEGPFDSPDRLESRVLLLLNHVNVRSISVEVIDEEESRAA